MRSMLPEPVPVRPPGADVSGRLTALLSEQEARWQRGEAAPVEACLDRQPWLPGDSEAVLQLLLQEVLLRQERGETPELAEYQRRFPHPGRAARGPVRGRTRHRRRRRRSPAPCRGRARKTPPSVRRPGVRLRDCWACWARAAWASSIEARQRALKRLVALKMIARRRSRRAGGLARFRREAEAVARLQHPNIVQIHEVGDASGAAVLLPGAGRGRQPGGETARPAASRRARPPPGWKRWPAPCTTPTAAASSTAT